MSRWSRPCYDKPRRCPGWAGGGWKYARVTLCPEEKPGGFSDDLMDGKPRGYLPIDSYESRWWRWKIHTCPDCGVKVLPYMVRWTSWRTWQWEIEYRVRNFAYDFPWKSRRLWNKITRRSAREHAEVD